MKTRMNITVPAELRDRMAQADALWSKANWSQIAAAAFEAHLRRERRAPDFDPIQDEPIESWLHRCVRELRRVVNEELGR